jgi:hypothetical protein
MTKLIVPFKERAMKKLRDHRALLTLLCLCSIALSSCAQEEKAESPIEAQSAAGITTRDAKMDLPLAPPPHEWTIEVEERDSSDELMELLWSIYNDHVHGRTAHPHPPEDTFEPGHEQGGCYNCGRETGFLPTPVVALESVSPLDHKATSFVTLRWEAVEGANSYRAFLIQVNEDQGVVNQMSTTDVHTEGVGLGLDHGFSYVMYVIAYHEVTKDYSIPSEPVMMRCSLSYGCALLTEVMSQAAED